MQITSHARRLLLGGLLGAAVVLAMPSSASAYSCYSETCERCEWSEGQQKFVCKIRFINAYCTCVMDGGDCWYDGTCRIIV